MLELEDKLFYERYDIIQPIGKGGQADVYLVTDGKTEAVLKVVPINVEGNATEKELADALQELDKEAEIYQKIPSSHLPTYIDSGYTLNPLTKRDEYYLLMEKVPGECLNRQKLIEKDIQAILEQGIEVLTELRDHGKKHRDVTPNNLIYDSKTKHLTLIDCGIARDTNELTMLTNLGRTPDRYSAPEVLRGEGTSYESDLYGLGASLESVMGNVSQELKGRIKLLTSDNLEDRLRGADGECTALVQQEKDFKYKYNMTYNLVIGIFSGPLGVGIAIKNHLDFFNGLLIGLLICTSFLGVHYGLSYASHRYKNAQKRKILPQQQLKALPNLEQPFRELRKRREGSPLIFEPRPVSHVNTNLLKRIYSNKSVNKSANKSGVICRKIIPSDGSYKKK